MMIDIEQVVASPWLYAVLVALILTDVYVPILPSGTTLIVATAYAATHETPVYPLLLCAAASSLVGDLLAFILARAANRRLSRMLAALPRVRRVDDGLRALLEQRGAHTVLVARFVPAGRCIVTNAAGRTRTVPLHRFVAWSGLAASCWATYTVTIGYVNAQIFDTGWLAAAVSIVCVLLLGLWFRRSASAETIVAQVSGDRTREPTEYGHTAK